MSAKQQRRRMMVDWSELPKELVHMISEHIDNEIDLIRFRSICSNWRSSSISNHHTNILPFKFPLLKYVLNPDDVFEVDLSDSINEYQFSDNMNINDSNFPFSYLSKRTIFLIKPPQQQTLTCSRPWIYAVNLLGRTVVVGPDSIVHLAAQPIVSGVIQKLLVESEGKLLLVNMCESYCPDFFGIDLFQLDENENKWVRLGGFDEKKNEWVKLRDIGDRVLFLGFGCSFSAYASELGLPKGNCVVFIDDSVLSCHNMVRGHCIFHLDQDQLSPVSEYPEYFNLFLPPEWILKS